MGKPRSYLPHVDGLRAIAVSVVVLYHAFPKLIPGGFVGVDVFFVISGFLITSLIIKEVDAGTFSIWDFYERRIRRLLPAATVVLLATFLAAGWILMPEQFRAFGKSLTASALFYANIYFRKNVGYFDGPADEKPLLHMWSLAVEEQFYVIWPLLILLAARFLTPRLLTGLLATLMLASLSYAQIKVQDGSSAAFYLLQSRLWELGLGALLALTPLGKHGLAPGLRTGLLTVGLLLITVSAFALSSTTPFPGLTAVPVCIGTAMVIAAGRDGQVHQPVFGLLTNRAMIGLGLISYSLYLWHWPLLSLARQASSAPLTPSVLATLILISVILAAATWRWIEQPLRKRDPRHLPSNIVARGTGVILATAFLGATINWGHGWGWRWDETVRTITAQIAETNPRRSRCDAIKNINRNHDECRWGPQAKEAGQFELALFGDSNADQFAGLAEIYARKLELTGRQITNSACAPVIGLTLTGRRPSHQERCKRYQKALLDWVKAQPNLKLAILSANWQSYPFGDLARASRLNGLPIHPETKSWMQKLGVPDQTDARLALLSTILTLRDRGVHVHLLGQVPFLFSLEKMPIECVVDALRQEIDVEACGPTTGAARVPLSASNGFLELLAQKMDGVSTALPSDILCDENRCDVYRDGAFLYRDRGHINASGARYLASKLPMPDLQN